MISKASGYFFRRKFLFRTYHQLTKEQLNITEACKDQIKRKLIPKGRLLRLSVKGGEGCDGFTYEFKAETDNDLGNKD